MVGQPQRGLHSRLRNGTSNYAGSPPGPMPSSRYDGPFRASPRLEREAKDPATPPCALKTDKAQDADGGMKLLYGSSASDGSRVVGDGGQQSRAIADGE